MSRAQLWVSCVVVYRERLPSAVGGLGGMDRGSRLVDLRRSTRVTARQPATLGRLTPTTPTSHTHEPHRTVRVLDSATPSVNLVVRVDSTLDMLLVNVNADGEVISDKTMSTPDCYEAFSEHVISRVACEITKMGASGQPGSQHIQTPDPRRQHSIQGRSEVAPKNGRSVPEAEA